MNAPLYLARSGYIDGTIHNIGYDSGFYWSSTFSNLERTRLLGFNSGNILPENSNFRYYGFSLRCVLREFTYSVVGTGPNNDDTIPNGIDLTGSQNVGYAPNAFTTIMNTHPLYFIRSGYLDGITIRNFGNSGGYWSSTIYSSTNAYYLGFHSGALYPALHGDRDFGRSLRCLSR